MKSGIVRVLGLTSATVLAAACQGNGDTATKLEGRSGLDVRSGLDIQTHLDALPSARVIDVDKAGVPTSLQGNLGAVEVREDDGKIDVRSALVAVAPAFRANAADLVLKKVHHDSFGNEHLRFQQMKHGLPVIGGELVLHVNKGILTSANGQARDDLPAPREPRIDASAAITAARGAVPSLPEALAAGEAKLAYVRTHDVLSLVYQVEVTGMREDGTPIRDTVLVDAASGKVVRRIPHIHSAKSREIHDLAHGMELPGALSRVEGQEPVEDHTVNTNYEHIGTTYDCYATLFGRDSLDGLGATLVSSVHFGENFVNAFWTGTQMVYGDGDGVTASNLAESMDITAHELTHAITERTSGLEYAGESGGLNEAMSDIFGNVCEWFRAGRVVDANTWKIGEDVWTPAVEGDALRYMADPAHDGISLDYFPDYEDGVDVHFSSGIANLAFYLLAQGGTHPRGKTSVEVRGIGVEKAARVFYLANMAIMTPTTTFDQAKTATEQAARILGFPDAEFESVSKAWEAVGVGVPIPPPTATALENGVPVASIGGDVNSKQYFTLEVPEGATSLTFTIEGGEGDADLYVLFGEPPRGSKWECRPFGGDSNETCTITDVKPGTYWVMVRGFSPYSGVTLTGTYGDGAALVINEIDYDNVGADRAEFVEIFNGSASPVNLAGHSLVFVDGQYGEVYATVDLGQAGTLGAGQFLVVGSPSVSVPEGALKLNFQGPENQIQNGGPDGVALVKDGATLDALSYEGRIAAANIPNVGEVSLVEGNPFTTADSGRAERSLCRIPSGADTDDAATDWAATSTVTPGAANVP
ncbi:M4 family metallopeptidase [Polyangium sp. 15x6]|uniref:M4 family metallopeptidase n=1 Tax=Polyangium sp. 15x6 TaxID=3042687 RepID=UPI00249B9B0C|nr:M4 family metallopeptidase [Polyangium sp. 15x6]MDI3286629.1 M4 family metallopeptidase [Polyangium sp. 15x6]